MPKSNARSDGLGMHIGRTLICVLRHMWDISSIELQGTIDHLVNSTATVSSMVQNSTLVMQGVCVCNFVGVFPRQNEHRAYMLNHHRNEIYALVVFAPCQDCMAVL